MVEQFFIYFLGPVPSLLLLLLGFATAVSYIIKFVTRDM